MPVAAVLALSLAAASVDLAAEKRELLRLVEQERTAHLAYDADLLVAPQADGFVSVSDGKVNRPTREQALTMFKGYFAAVSFKAWDDLVPPEVTLSDDATLATVLVQKRVRLTSKAQPDGPVNETDFAWLETWRKQAGEWRFQSIVSTSAPARKISD